jgi:serine/threonine-protein kinase HipA
MTRLSIVGDTGLGALKYAPSSQEEFKFVPFTLDEIAQESLGVLANEAVENLDLLFELGGSSGGARPKIMTTIDNQDWIIKFASQQDLPSIGAQEFAYSQCAKACGISMSETRLFPSELTDGYFGTRRFDRYHREDGSTGRVHTASVSALLETSHRYPTLDYHALMKLTLELTRDFASIEQQYRRMCLNVFAHNRDDHAKNFGFQFIDDRWELSPAYDLTYSHSVGGEHATSVNGSGKDPGLDDLLAVAKGIGMNLRTAKAIATEISEITNEMLGLEPFMR